VRRPRSHCPPSHAHHSIAADTPPSSALEMELFCQLASSDSSSAASPETSDFTDWSFPTSPSTNSSSSPPASSPVLMFDRSGINSFQTSSSYDLSASPSHSLPSSGSMQLAAPETNPSSGPDLSSTFDFSVWHDENLDLNIMLSKIDVGSEASDQAAVRRRKKDPQYRCKFPLCSRSFTEMFNLKSMFFFSCLA